MPNGLDHGVTERRCHRGCFARLSSKETIGLLHRHLNSTRGIKRTERTSSQSQYLPTIVLLEYHVSIDEPISTAPFQNPQNQHETVRPIHALRSVHPEFRPAGSENQVIGDGYVGLGPVRVDFKLDRYEAIVDAVGGVLVGDGAAETAKGYVEVGERDGEIEGCMPGGCVGGCSVGDT